MRNLTVQELAERVSGRVEGNGTEPITGVAPVRDAEPGDLTFVVDDRYARALADVDPTAVLVPDALSLTADGVALIRVENPRAAFREAVRLLYPEEESDGEVDPTARIAPGARLGPRVEVGAYAVVESDAEIGEGTRIGAQTVVKEGARVGAECVIGEGCTVSGAVRMGDRVRVQTGARLGTEGYGYVDEGGQLGTADYGESQADNAAMHVPQIGRCVIGDDVEIGANTTIDRGAIGNTVIGDRTKIDNLVHVGHNVRVGEDCMIVAQVGVAGSTEIGDRVQMAGQAGISGHLTIGDGARIAAQAGVIGDVPEGATYSGYPARPHRKAMRASAALFRLPDLLGRLRSLEERLGDEEPEG